MDYELLVCKKVSLDRFVNESYCGKNHILALIEEGSFRFHCGKGWEEAHPLEAVNFKEGVSYERHVTTKASLWLFRYRSEECVFGDGRVLFQDTQRIRSTLKLLRICDSTVQTEDFAFKKALFGDLVCQYRLENSLRQSAHAREDLPITRAISFINGNLKQKINLKEIAQQNFLSYVQFSRRFQKVTGATPQDFVTAMRLKRAQSLLAETDLSIGEVGENCGFPNAYYFSNFFRKHSGFSPSQYRNTIRSTLGEKERD